MAKGGSSEKAGGGRDRERSEEEMRLDEVREVKGRLGELDLGARSGRSLEHTSSGEVKAWLGFLDVGTAVRMLKDYIDDLIKSNATRDAGVEMKILEYQGLRDELEGAESRGRLLTTQQRSKLILMLHDYEAVLELGSQARNSTDAGPWDVEETELISAADESVHGGGVPLYVSKGDFLESACVESLYAVLELCEKQVHEFTTVLLPGAVIFTHLSTHLVTALSSTVSTKFSRYRDTLRLLEKMDLERDRVSSNLRNSVSFCFESLVGLARRFQLVDDLLRKCGGPEWYKTALELANVRPRKRIQRWSEFSLAVRNSEWSVDIVELAFHALEKLLTLGTYTVKDASFKWSPENGRMVLQIPGRGEASGPESVLLEWCRELEEKDLMALTVKLDELTMSEREKKKFYTSHSNAHGIASFLSEKLRGPTPEVGTYVPYSFTRFDSSSLRYVEYLDKGSSGMVAIHEWFGVKVAVKSVRIMGLSRESFEREAAVLAMAQHPNVVRLIGCGFLERSSTGQLVMELMDHDLRTVIDQRLPALPPGSSPFSPMVAIDLMLQIAQAMLYLSQNRILHRDLKAKNVLVNICKPLRTSRKYNTANTRLMGSHEVSAVLPHTQENYVAKLADFGLARCRPQSSYVTTAMAGTTGWRAPEIFHFSDPELANEYRWPADVYSFAMTGYEILTGKLPFEFEPHYSLHDKIMSGVRPSLHTLRSDFPEAVKELIQKCWATDPQHRPDFEYIVKRLWECKVLAILPGFERKIMQSPNASGRVQ